MSSFADSLLATAVSRGTGRRGVTIRIVCNLIGADDAGAWLEGTAWLSGQEDNLAFTEAEARADGNWFLRLRVYF